MTDAPFHPPIPSIQRQADGLLAGPVIWAVYFLAAYAVGEFGCLSGALNYRVGGLHVLTLITVVLTAAALFGLGLMTMWTYRLWRKLSPPQVESLAGARGSDEPRRLEETRTRFVSLGGVLLAALFGFSILLSAIPLLVLEPCRP